MNRELEGPVPASEDADLLDRVQRGDEQAMAGLFDRYSRIVYSVALRVLRDPAAAEDVMQEIFMADLAQSEQLRRGQGKPWWLAVGGRQEPFD